jgi:hypothetical protein
MATGRPFSKTAIAEFVVPRSIPTAHVSDGFDDACGFNDMGLLLNVQGVKEFGGRVDSIFPKVITDSIMGNWIC